MSEEQATVVALAPAETVAEPVAVATRDTFVGPAPAVEVAVPAEAPNKKKAAAKTKKAAVPNKPAAPKVAKPKAV